MRRHWIAVMVAGGLAAACGGGGSSSPSDMSASADFAGGAGDGATGGDAASGGDGGSGTGCAAHTNCADCLADTACGWCNASNTCTEGVATGPDNGMCSRNWIVSGFGTCDGMAPDGGVENQYGSTMLPVDCRLMTNWTDPRCLDDTQRTSGTLGKGPTIDQAGIGAQITGCFVDAANHRVVAGARLDDGGGNPLGAVFTVDLTSGDRAVVSGTWSDPSSGTKTTGSGPSFGAVTDVKPGAANGQWYVASTTQIFTVDPSSGARTLFWDGTATASACMAGGQQVASYSGDLALAGDGTFYLAGGPSAPGGVYAVKSGKCTVITQFDGTMGTGPNLDASSAFNHIAVLSSGGVFGDEFPSNDVYSIALATGNWTVVSSADASAPVGMGGALGSGVMVPYLNGHLLVRGDDGSGSTIFTDVNPTGGDRVTHEVVDQPGPKPTTDGLCLATLTAQPFWVVDDGIGFILYEPATGLTNDLSY